MLIHNVLFPESVSALLIKSTLKTPILPKKGAYQSLWRKNIKIDILKFEHEILHTGLLQSLKCVRRVRMPSSIRLKSNNLNGVVQAAFTLSLVCHYLVILKTNQEMKLIMTLLFASTQSSIQGSGNASFFIQCSIVLMQFQLPITLLEPVTFRTCKTSRCFIYIRNAHKVIFEM